MTNLGHLLYSVRKDYDEAEKLYSKAIEISPEDPSALNNLGLLLTTVRKDFDQVAAPFPFQSLL